MHWLIYVILCQIKAFKHLFNFSMSFLTLCILMDSSLWFDKIKSIVNIYGCEVIILKNDYIFCLKIFFTLTTSIDPDEILHAAAGSSLFVNVSLLGFPVRI